EPVVHLVAEVAGSQGGDLRRPCRWHRVVRQLDDIQGAAVRRTEGGGSEEEFLDCGVSILLSQRFVFRRCVNGEIESAFVALRGLVLANHDGSGEAWPVFVGEGVGLESGGNGRLRGRGMSCDWLARRAGV